MARILSRSWMPRFPDAPLDKRTSSLSSDSMEIKFSSEGRRISDSIPVKETQFKDITLASKREYN